jgi:hypothetical protein
MPIFQEEIHRLEMVLNGKNAAYQIVKDFPVVQSQ